MPVATVDGIVTRYQVLGSGPPLLMLSPGGFNATLESWSSLGAYARTRPLEALSRDHTCIVFDRREAGESGGRVERITWAHYVAQARGLLDHLGIARAHLVGGCTGCSLVLAFAVAHPRAVASMVLYWPAGGVRYRLNCHSRFAQHLAFVEEHGLQAVAALASESGKPFGADPRGGPWASVIHRDPEFARSYVTQDVARYKALVAGMARGLFDRDTGERRRARGPVGSGHPHAGDSWAGRRARHFRRPLCRRVSAAGAVLGHCGGRADATARG